ncbi:hypothetical protein COY27_06415 [Candidatus Woesearchaeota archaeon CG_4_10_14_0_2_um_filter_33_13]|nr:MAG: hypothetical protein COY27_06415 [Candidatus Woesearchaeota archaeon CG_4_10_14_0_2_um_filter_33_13]
MKQTIEEIKFGIEREYERISSITKEKYNLHIKLLNSQYNLLFEFLANYYEYGNMKHQDSNQFILCYSLFSEMVRKQKITIQLILCGDYSEAAELVRHSMQSCYQIIYLSKNGGSWKKWFEQQNYEQDKLTNKEIKNPNTIFSNFKKLLDELNKSQYYLTYQKLCSWSHPSIESLRSNLELSKEQMHKYFFTNRFSEDKAEGLLNLLFGLINEANWIGFKEVFVIKEPIPEVLLKYKELQKEANNVFDKFYDTNKFF